MFKFKGNNTQSPEPVRRRQQNRRTSSTTTTIPVTAKTPKIIGRSIQDKTIDGRSVSRDKCLICIGNDLLISIIGNMLVGKSGFIYRYVDHLFYEHTMPTIGMDLTLKTIIRQKSDNNNKRIIRLQIWDTAGQGKVPYAYQFIVS
ncbi:uncharacterized protein LOC128951559 [Oppia nitens]|uniref:uncharacterized protein LOC128951559 n=1 Tax=Oppia nitens TaxID=1686743 RepID=UPI0023DCB7CF|nr:uncharacterized protein LOC128951559 [Oppia nitens]